MYTWEIGKKNNMVSCIYNVFLDGIPVWLWQDKRTHVNRQNSSINIENTWKKQIHVQPISLWKSL